MYRCRTWWHHCWVWLGVLTTPIGEFYHRWKEAWNCFFSLAFSYSLGALFSHIEVEELRLLLVGPSLGQTRFVQVAVRHAGLDRLGGRAVGEALGDVVVVQHRHVLQGVQSGAPGLLHLEGDRKMDLFYSVAHHIVIKPFTPNLFTPLRGEKNVKDNMFYLFYFILFSNKLSPDV